jgi:hypothetical protein
MADNMVFVVVRRSTMREEAWQLARLFTNIGAAEEYQEMVQLGDQWETTIQCQRLWNDGLLTS